MAHPADCPGGGQGGGHVCGHNDSRIESASGATCRVGEEDARRPMVLPWLARAVIGGLLCVAWSLAWGQDATADQEATSDLPETTEPVPDQWIHPATRAGHGPVR